MRKKLEAELNEITSSGCLRQLKEVERLNSVYVNKGSRELISFSCNDYFGMSANPLVKQAAIDAIEKYGVGSGASRFVTGNNILYNELESKLAEIKLADAALVFGSGYLANVGVISSLVGPGDLVVADKLIHASLIDGIKLSGAKLVRFQHNDASSCIRQLVLNRAKYKNCIIVTETVFSMDGDVAPVALLKQTAEAYDALLVTDDAHGLFLVSNPVKADIQIGTLSKGIGSYGGYVCAEERTIEFLKNKARSLIYATALPPATLAASIKALEILGERQDLPQKAFANAKYFTKLMGLPEATSLIVPVIVGDAKQAVELSSHLEENGFLVQAIRPPTVLLGTSRLRFTFSALHTKEMIEGVVMTIRK